MSLLPVGIGSSGDYEISRSVRLRSSASAYFNRTSGTPTSGSIFTHSFWVKRGVLGAQQTLISGQRPTNFDRIYFTASDTLVYQWNDGTSNLLYLETTQVFRDPSAWYHIVVATDTTQATSSNRAKIYINGVQVTAFSTATYPTQNSTSYLNRNATTLNLGRTTTAAFYLDGYLTEVNFIDGQALTPSSFGETNAVTGVWQPKKYAGTYGTNGFYLNFSDNSAATAAAIGADSSGNGNNWTPNNISVTAGVTYDSMLDVPTQWADGGNGRGNYATLNPLVAGTASYISGGNLNASVSATNTSLLGTFQFPSSGKWYFEYQITTIGGGSSPMGGVASTISYSPAVFYRTDGTKLVDGTGSSYGASYTTTDTISVAVDVDGGTVTFYKNNSSQGAITYSGGGFYAALRSSAATDVFNINFGQRPFAYTPPTGFKALHTGNLPEPTILKGNQYFDATTYTGNGSTQSIVNAAGFAPDLLWIKSRSGATDHGLHDRVRGEPYARLASNSTAAETTGGSYISSFGGLTSSGFELNSNSSGNSNAATYVGWQWKEGATQGFDIVTYTGTGVNRTVSHSLGVAPKMIIVKQRNAVRDWPVYHANFTSASYVGFLNSTAAQSLITTTWNATAPTSSVFSVGTDAYANQSTGTYVAYLFSEVAGFSKFGSYVGNGSADGPFVFCGFRPRFVMWKNASAAKGWLIEDGVRSPYNQVALELYPHSSGAEAAGSSRSPTQQFDFLSNGFKVRGAQEQTNGNGNTIIFAAFAEVPYKFALGR